MGSETKVLMVLANQDFQDTEYSETCDALRAAGIDITIAASLSEECKGAMGTEVSVDYSFDDVNPDEFQALVLIGGTGVEGYIHDVTLHEIAKSAHSSGKIVAAICWAPSILANAGILQGKMATSWSGAAKVLTECGAQFVRKPLVIDGNIITADGPDSSTAFGQAIAKALLG